MTNDEILTDDYVAGLLATEANDCSLKYSALGMEAYRTEKKPANMLRPNKRFLRHIIKDTHTHNKALLAKEAAESEARLRELERIEDAKRVKTNPNSRDIRKRQMGDIQAILGGKKRRRDDGEATASTQSSTANRRREPASPARGERDLIKARDGGREHHGRLSRVDDDRLSRSSSRKEDRQHRGSRRHRESEAEKGGSSERSRRHRDRSRSPKRSRRSWSPDERSRKERRRSPLREETRRRDKDKNKDRDDDEDSPDDLIGPAPPPTFRGRGKHGGSLELDRRFSDSYDPKTDVQMDEDVLGDWDDAVEAFRDRQKLRANQETRLRAAGFAPGQIQKAAGADEGRLGDDVRWSEAGAPREWDLGKHGE